MTNYVAHVDATYYTLFNSGVHIVHRKVAMNDLHCMLIIASRNIQCGRYDHNLYQFA